MPRYDAATENEYHPAVPGEQPRRKEFVRFTLPGRELRRLVGEAKAANESFTIEYTVQQPPDDVSLCDSWPDVYARPLFLPSTVPADCSVC